MSKSYDLNSHSPHGYHSMQVSGGILREPPSNTNPATNAGANQPSSVSQPHRPVQEPPSDFDESNISNMSAEPDVYKSIESNKPNENQRQDGFKPGGTEISEPSNESHENFNKSPNNNYQTSQSRQAAPQPSQAYPTQNTNFQGNYQAATPLLKRESSSSNLSPARGPPYPSTGSNAGLQKNMPITNQRPNLATQNQPLPQRPPSLSQPSKVNYTNPTNFPPPRSNLNPQNFSVPRTQVHVQRSSVPPSYNSNPSSYSSSMRQPSPYNYPPRTVNDAPPRPIITENSRNLIPLTPSRTVSAYNIEEDKSSVYQDQALLDSIKTKSINNKPMPETPTRAVPPPITRSSSDLNKNNVALPPVKKESEIITKIKEEENERFDFESLTMDEETINPSVPEIKNVAMDGSVSGNIKFFEEKDKGRIPMVPKPIKIDQIREQKPVRPIDIPLKQAIGTSDDNGGGVDESPIKHPNLRSTSLPPQKVARIKNQIENGVHLQRSRSVCSAKSNKKHVKIAPIHSTPQTPKKVLTYEEQASNFFYSTIRKNRVFHVDDAEHDSGVDDGKENGPPTNGGITTPKRTQSRNIADSAKRSVSSPAKLPLKSPGTPGKSLAQTPELSLPSTPLIKKVPMNKIQVGSAPSPNLKAVKSKIGSLSNTTYKPGGGNIRIENQKLDFSSAQSKVTAKNSAYAPSGGDKKITQVKLQWNAKSKIGSLDNTSHKPGGGDKKIENVKLDFKDKAKSKVSSKENMKYVPGGGNVKNSNSTPDEKNIENQKLDVKAKSKIGSFDNLKHKPGGGDVTIFDDRHYMKQGSISGSDGRGSGTQSPLNMSKSISEISQDDGS